jgi:transcriptional regulator with XRE-family HTH domain
MKIEDIQELMELKGWSLARLADALDLTENAVYRWVTGRHEPKGPAAILMGMWLKEARLEAEARPVPGKRKEAAHA